MPGITYVVRLHCTELQYTAPTRVRSQASIEEKIVQVSGELVVKLPMSLYGDHRKSMHGWCRDDEDHVWAETLRDKMENEGEMKKWSSFEWQKAPPATEVVDVAATQERTIHIYFEP